MSDAVAAVVLAAGLSSRMGRNKLLLELGGESVLRRAVKAAIAGGLAPVLVVIGNDHELAQEELAGLPCATVYNPLFETGMTSSLQAGIFALPDTAAGAVVMLADMPFVTAEMLRALVQRWRESRKPLAISLYGDVFAPPTLYGRELFQDLLDLDGKGCGKRVVKQHRGEALELSWPEAALADLDVPADVERIRAQLEGG